jgi:hypothetical protein
MSFWTTQGTQKKMPSQTLIDLSRWQFATTAAFHMTFPALSVGLAIFLVICYGCYYKTGNPLYLQMFRFWRKIFAIGFALGVVSATTSRSACPMPRACSISTTSPATNPFRA